MSELQVKLRQVFVGLAPIRNCLTWSNDKRLVVFSSLNDLCCVRSSSFSNYERNGLLETFPLNNPAVCLAFVRNAFQHSGEENLLVIDSVGQLYNFCVSFLDNLNVTFLLRSSNVVSTFPPDFVYGFSVGTLTYAIWNRRDVIYCQEIGSGVEEMLKLKADVKCFDAVVLANNRLFAVVGCVNGNVYFVDICFEDGTDFRLIALASPLPVPVLHVAVQRDDADSIAAAYSHGYKTTTVRWNVVKDDGNLQQNADFGDHMWHSFCNASWQFVTESVIADFSNDVCALDFLDSGTRLLIVTNGNEYGVYDYVTDPGSGLKSWQNVVLGGEAGERTFGYCGGKLVPSVTGDIFVIYTTKGYLMRFDIVKNADGYCYATEKPPPLTGHASAIADAEWDPSGHLLFTADRTGREIRVLARLSDNYWWQIARPEAHQHDVSCLALLSGLTMVVGSDEFMYRVYRASSNFVDSVEALTGVDAAQELVRHWEALPTVPFFQQPVLGVLNVAVGEAEGKDDSAGQGVIFEDRPTTNELTRFTFWEVTESLYGHPNSALSIAVDDAARFVATSCSAASANDATILVRRTSDWNITSKLQVHALDATQLAFAPDGSKLLSVSRDRSWAVFTQAASDEWQLHTHMPSAHSRMLLCCAWIDEASFLTGGRDGELNLWHLKNDADASPEKVTIVEKDAVAITGLAFDREDQVLAVGFSNGKLGLGVLQSGILSRFTYLVPFSLAVTTIKFRPRHRGADDSVAQLAAGSDSGVIKLFDVSL